MKGYIKNRTYYKHEKEKSILRMGGGSWTINLSQVPIDKIDNIVYFTKENVYKISSWKAMAIGFKRMFKDEYKLIVPLVGWEKSKRKMEKLCHTEI